MWTTLYLFFFCPCNRGDLISVTVPLSIVTFLLFGVRVLQWLFCGPRLWCVMVYSTLCSTVVSKIHKKNKLCVFCMIFLFLFFQVMNSVSCGKRHNVNFLTIFIFFLFYKASVRKEDNVSARTREGGYGCYLHVSFQTRTINSCM